MTDKPLDGKGKLQITIITADLKTRASQNYTACAAILNDCGLKFEVTIDRAELMKLSKGRVNPIDGFLMILTTKNAERFAYDWNHLVRWIDDHGLKPI